MREKKKSGAVKGAKRVRTEPAISKSDPVTADETPQPFLSKQLKGSAKAASSKGRPRLNVEDLSRRMRDLDRAWLSSLEFLR